MTLERLTSIASAGRCDTFAAQRFALLAAPEFTRLFIAFFQLQPFEETVVLNLFLQNAHRLFNIVIVDFDCNFLQVTRPLPAIGIFSEVISDG
jgi:hypothetical protein